MESGGGAVGRSKQKSVLRGGGERYWLRSPRTKRDCFISCEYRLHLSSIVKLGQC